MRKPLSALPLFFCLIAFPANAQLAGEDTAPESSCAGFPSGATRMTGDADGDGGQVILICDGTLWKAATPSGGGLEYSSSGAYAIVSNDLKGMKGGLDGTYDSYPDVDVAGIGFTSSGYTFLGGMGSSSSLFSGIWARDYDSYFGQTYEANEPEGSFSGMYIRDKYRIEFKYYGETVFSLTDGIFRMPLNSSAPLPCSSGRYIGSMAMTSTGTLCTCTSSGWRNAANTANCSW